jgi:hypothetical protein
MGKPTNSQDLFPAIQEQYIHYGAVILKTWTHHLLVKSLGYKEAIVSIFYH